MGEWIARGRVRRPVRNWLQKVVAVEMWRRGWIGSSLGVTPRVLADGLEVEINAKGGFKMTSMLWLEQLQLVPFTEMGSYKEQATWLEIKNIPKGCSFLLPFPLLRSSVLNSWVKSSQGFDSIISWNNLLWRCSDCFIAVAKQLAQSHPELVLSRHDLTYALFYCVFFSTLLQTKINCFCKIHIALFLCNSIFQIIGYFVVSRFRITWPSQWFFTYFYLCIFSSVGLQCVEWGWCLGAWSLLVPSGPSLSSFLQTPSLNTPSPSRSFHINLETLPRGHLSVVWLA